MRAAVERGVREGRGRERSGRWGGERSGRRVGRGVGEGRSRERRERRGGEMSGRKVGRRSVRAEGSGKS
jgi:hypothetical protein